METRQLLESFREIGLADNRIPPIDRFGFVPRNLHRHGSRHPRSFQVTTSWHSHIYHVDLSPHTAASLLQVLRLRLHPPRIRLPARLPCPSRFGPSAAFLSVALRPTMRVCVRATVWSGKRVATHRRCAAASRADASLDRHLAEPPPHCCGGCDRALGPESGAWSMAWKPWWLRSRRNLGSSIM